MGKYTFDCKTCGRLELDLIMSQIPLEKCPVCDSTEIQRVWDKAVPSIWNCGGSYSGTKMS